MPEKLSSSFDLLFSKLSGWFDAFVLHLPNILVAIVVVTAMFFLSKYVKKLVRNLMGRFTSKKSIVRLLSNLVSGALVFLSLILVLSILDLEETVTSMLAGAGILGLVAGLAFQDALTNTFAGIIISVKDHYSINDHIEVNGLEGLIKEIGFRFTIIETFQGQNVIVPNKTIVNSSVKNYSSSGNRRIDLACSISYGDDLEKGKSVATEAIEDTKIFDLKKGVQFFYTSFGDSAINFSLRFWLPERKSHPDFLEARSRAIIAVKKAFAKNNLSIPFPIRTLDIGENDRKQLVNSISEKALSN